MALKPEIYKLIRNNTKLRIAISEEIGVLPPTVYNHAVRKAPALESYVCVKAIMNFTNLAEDAVIMKQDGSRV